MKLYAFATPEIAKHAGYLKIGETNGSVEERVKQQGHELNVTKEVVWQDAVYTERTGIDKMLHRHLVKQGFPIQRFDETGQDTEWVKCTVAELQKAFEDVKRRIFDEEKQREEVGNQFYLEIRNWYYWATETNEIDAEYALRLVVRLLFCYFIREKELVPKELFDENFGKEHLKENEYRYYNAVLRNLFFRGLNTPIAERKGIEYEKLIKNTRHVKEQFAKIPFLNGGIFNIHKGDDIPLNDDYFFSDERTRHLSELEGNYKVCGIIRILSKYSYKLSLDDLLDHADYAQTIDPEFIGKVFESLLACIDMASKETRRKITGSYYTPREIVDYMVNEALNSHLDQRVGNRPPGGCIGDSQLETADGPESAIADVAVRRSATHLAQPNDCGSEVLLQCKILDPACGSGAFPCGIMNEIMRRLDPHRTLPQSERYRNKLKILQQVIYGIDIQPIAVQISQLRLFLSLIQEIVPDKRQHNYGIEPLPNLETKFVCADTLISLKNGRQRMLESPLVRDLTKQLRETRSRHFMASNVQEKQWLRQSDESLRKMLLMAMEESLTHETTEKLAMWDPYNQSCSVPFFDPMWMFGIEKFDIVIGNPPYLKQEYFSEKRKELYYNEFHFYADLYVYFIFAGFNLVQDRGVLCFIANDSFLGFKNTKNVRNLFFKNDLRQIIQCGMVFESADIYPAIFLLKKQKSETLQYETGTYNQTKNKYLKAGKVGYALSQNLVHQRLVVNSPITELFHKFLAFGKMRDICSVLDTGIHTGNCRSKLLFQKREKSNLKKILQGKQISRYAFDWNSPQAKFKYCDIHYVPQDENGIGRGGKMSKAKEYWHFCGAESNHRVDEKILLRQTDDDLVACYINREKDGLFYTDNTLFTVLPKEGYHILFVLGLLNSRLLNTLYHFLSQEEGKSLAQVKTQVVGFLPVPHVDKTQQRPLINLVVRRLKGEPVDAKIDALVYKLYSLTDTEVAIVEERT